MLLAFIVMVSLFSLLLAVTWSTSNFINVIVKLGFYIITFWGAYLLFNLLPAVELPNGMRLF